MMKELELFALEWLRFEKRCPVALFERSPRPFHGRPDVLGITKDRYLVEIEIKRSISDFKANERKDHVLTRECHVAKWPLFFWFLVPSDIADKAMGLLPEYAGLLRAPRADECQQISCIVKAPKNNASERLTTREMMELGHCMANQIYSNHKVIWHQRFQIAYLQAELAKRKLAA